MSMIDKITQLLAKLNKEIYPEDLAQRLKLKGRDLEEFWRTIKSMEKRGLLKFSAKGAVKLRKQKQKNIEGIIEINSKGFGFVLVKDEQMKAEIGDKDVFIASDKLGSAMHGDRVLVKIIAQEPGKNPAGEIIEVLERAHQTIVGNLVINGKIAFVVPDNKKIIGDIYIPMSQLNGAKTSQKVAVKITKWAAGGKKNEGRITEILGNLDQSDIEILSIIKQQNLSLQFPVNVLQAAKNIASEVDKKELKNRRDLRETVLVTIDGEDARDLDDAVSVQYLPDGCYKLGVYIADVSYYVPQDGIIDAEAVERSTSVYLVDRVLPMLPVELSNGICSLNAGVDRLAMACEMVVDKNGKINAYEIFPAVIKVDRRLTYTLVNQILTGVGVFRNIEEYDDLKPQILQMRSLCEILKQKRRRRGAIDFEFPEQKVKLDATGKPIEIVKREHGIAESIIEEFMLAANETVAEHLSKLEYPSIYRVHDLPNAEKIAALQKLLYNFDIKLDLADEIKPLALQQALAGIKGTPHEKLVATVMLRSLKQAVYQTDNVGHFGLAAEFYTHFTSPIRRYPDLEIHRLLKASFVYGKKLPKKEWEKLTAILPKIAEQASVMERKAAEAERMSVEYKTAEYMAERLGEQFDGTISSVNSFGFFVELENGVEGLVHVNNLLNDYYLHDEENYTLVGERTGAKYRLGDSIRVEVLHVNVQEREIDFMPADTPLEQKLLLKAEQRNYKPIFGAANKPTGTSKPGKYKSKSAAKSPTPPHEKKPKSTGAKAIAKAVSRKNGKSTKNKAGQRKATSNAGAYAAGRSGKKPTKTRSTK